MAERICTLTEVPNPGTGGEAWVATWTGLLNGDTGAWLELPGYSDRSAHVTGTFGAGGSCKIEGANDAAQTAVFLNDPGGTVIAITAAGVKEVLEIVRYIRPKIAAGDGSTSLTVSMLLMRTKR